MVIISLVFLQKCWGQLPVFVGGDALGVEDRATISGHRRRGLEDGENWVEHRPLRIEPGSTARCVPPTPQWVTIEFVSYAFTLKSLNKYWWTLLQAIQLGSLKTWWTWTCIKLDEVEMSEHIGDSLSEILPPVFFKVYRNTVSDKIYINTTEVVGKC